MMKRSRQVRRGGFTLLEVLLVVGILALLAALVAPNLMRMGDTAKIDLATSQVKRGGTIGNALKSFRFHVGVYPETDEGLAALYEIPDSLDEEDGKWKGPYLEGDPEDLKDPWGNEFNYRFPGEINEEEFEIWSNGPNGKDDDGDEDDIISWRKK